MYLVAKFKQTTFEGLKVYKPQVVLQDGNSVLWRDTIDVNFLEKKDALEYATNDIEYRKQLNRV